MQRVSRGVEERAKVEVKAKVEAKVEVKVRTRASAKAKAAPGGAAFKCYGLVRMGRR